MSRKKNAEEFVAQQLAKPSTGSGTERYNQAKQFVANTLDRAAVSKLKSMDDAYAEQLRARSRPSATTQFSAGSTPQVNQRVNDYLGQLKSYENVLLLQDEKSQLENENKWLSSKDPLWKQNSTRISKIDTLLKSSQVEKPKRPLLEPKKYANQDVTGTKENSETIKLRTDAAKLLQQSEKERKYWEDAQKRYQPDSRDYADAKARWERFTEQYQALGSQLPGGVPEVSATDYSSPLARAKAAYAAAEDAFKTAESDYYNVPDGDFNGVQARYLEAEKNLEAAKKQLDDATKQTKAATKTDGTEEAQDASEEGKQQEIEEAYLSFTQAQQQLENAQNNMANSTGEDITQYSAAYNRAKKNYDAAKEAYFKLKNEADASERNGLLAEQEERVQRYETYRYLDGFQEAAEAGMEKGLDERDDPVSRYLANKTEYDAQAALSGTSISRYNFLADSELTMYYFLLNRYGLGEAKQYLNDLEVTLDKRISDFKNYNTEITYGTSDAIGKTVMNAATVPANIFGGVSSAAADVSSAITGKFNPYSAGHELSDYANTVRGITAQEIVDSIDSPFWGAVAANTYQAVMSGADSALGATLFGNGYTWIMGSSAASQRAQELYEKGVSGAQIGLGAIASGLIEAATEKYSIEYFTSHFLEGNITDFWDWTKKTLIQALNEGSEEVASDLANLVVDALLEGKNSDYRNNIQALVEHGRMSREEAQKQAFINQAIDTFWSFYGGTVSGGLMGGTGGIVNATTSDARKIGKDMVDSGSYDEILKNAVELGSKNKDVPKLQAKAEKGELGKRGSDYAKLTNIYQENIAALTKQDVSNVTNAIAAQAEKLGAEKNPGLIASGIVKKLTGEKLTMSERYAMAQNQTIADTLLNDISRAGSESGGSDWVRNIGTYRLAPEVFGTRETETEKSAKAAVHDQLDEAAESIFGKEHAFAIEQMYYPGQNRGRYVEEMAKAYKAGQEGIDMADIEGISSLTVGQVDLAYNLGKQSVDGSSFDYDGEAEGQSYLISDNSPVNISEIASTGGGGMVLLTDEGKQVNAQDVKFGSYGTARLFKAIETIGVNAQTGNTILEASKNSRLSNSNFAVAVLDAYNAGRNGVSMNAIGRDSNAMRLDEATREIAWEAGSDSKRAKNRQKQQTIDRGEHAARESGLTVKDSAKNIETLNEQQKSGMDAARLLSEMGLNITVYASTEKERNAGMENGSIYLEDGSIWVDLNAGADGQGVMAFALSHEFTHFVEEFSPEKFHRFTEILFEAVGTDVNINELIAAKAAALKRQGYKELSAEELNDLAYSEVVAETMETALTDTDVMERISARLQQTDMSLWGKIKKFLQGLVERLKKAYQGLNPDSSIAQLARDTIRSSEEALNAFADAASDAVVNYRLQDEGKNNAPGGVELSSRNNPDIRYSARDNLDSEYLELAKDPEKNRIELDEMVRGAAEKAGFVYKRNTKRKYAPANAVPWQMFVKGIDNELDNYGKYTYYATDAGAIPIGELMPKIQELAEEFYGNTLPEEEIDPQDIVMSAGIWDDMEFVQYLWDNYLEDVLDKTGSIPAIVTSNGMLVMDEDSTRVKSGAPVEYDDNGNVIPLSKRFDSGNEDIRFSRRISAEEQVDGKEAVEQALSEYRNQQNAEAKKMKAAYEAERKKIEQAYKQEMETMERLSGDITVHYQNEFLDALMATEDLGKKGIPQLRKQFRELAEKNSGEDEQALSARKEEYNRLLDEFLLNRDIGKLRVTIQQQRSRAKAKVESARKTEERFKLERVLTDLNRRLLNPTKTLYVPDSLQPAVTMAMQSIATIKQQDAQETASRVIARYGAQLERLGKDPVKNAQAIAETEAKLQNVLERRNATVQNALERLQQAYTDLAEVNKGVFTQEYNDKILEFISDAKEAIGDTFYGDLSTGQLQAVRNAYTAILNTIRNVNKLHGENLKQGWAETAQQAMAEFREQPDKTPALGKLKKTMEKLSWNNKKPYYAFERMGSSVMMQLYQNLRNGEDGWYRDFAKARAFLFGCMDKYHFDQWENNLVEVEMADGEKVALDLQERMSLYAASKREQYLKHLTQDGFILTGSKRGGKDYMDYSSHVLALETVIQIRNGQMLGLTAEQIAFANEMQEYLSTVCAEQNNEVSLALYGVSKAKEKDYWPIKSSAIRSERVRDSRESPGNRQKNAGHMKSTTKNASNAVELRGFMTTWADHVNDTAMYHNFTLPMEDFYRVYNYNTSGDGIRQQMLRKHGEASVDYVDTFLKDVNGGVRADNRESAFNMMLSGFKKGAVSASLSVAIQQPSAVGRAFSIIDAKYFVGSKVDSAGGISATWEEMKKYAPVVGLKDIGRFDTDMGRSTQELLSGENEKGFMAAVDKFSGWMPEQMDKITWVAMWEAAKRQTKAEHPGLSGEMLKAEAGKLFTKCITQTQVYDSVFSRSGNMRSKSVYMKMLTAFMAESTTTINMMESAVQDIRGKNFKTAGKKISSVAAALILNSLLASLVYAARDDDEEKTYLEKYLSSLASELVDGVNPITYYPGFKDVWSIVQGYDVERNDMSLVSDMYNATQKATDSWKKFLETDPEDEEARKENLGKFGVASLDAAAGLLNMGGIPLKNILRELRGVKNTYETVSTPRASDSYTRGKAIWDGIQENIPAIFRGSNGKTERLYSAIVAGSQAEQERLKTTYSTEQKYENAVVTALADQDSRIRQAAKKKAAGNAKEAERILAEIEAEGNFSRKQIDSAFEKKLKKVPGGSKESVKEQYLNGEIDRTAAIKQLTGVLGMRKKDAEEQVTQWNSVRDTGIEYDEIRDSYLNNSLTESKAAQMLVRYGGKSEDAAKKTVREWGCKKDLDVNYSEVKEAFIDGEITEQQLKNALIRYGGKDAEEAEETVKAYRWQKQHPGSDLSSSQILAYTKELDGLGKSIEATGIQPNVFADYRNKRTECTGVDADGDGKTDSGSKKNEILALIDSLPISDSQKDALYFDNGYAASGLKKAPWHRR